MAIRRLRGNLWPGAGLFRYFHWGIFMKLAPFVVFSFSLFLWPPAVAAPVRKVTLDPRDQPVLKERRVSRAYQAHKGRRAHKVPRDLRVRQGKRATRETKAIREARALPDCVQFRLMEQ